MRLPHPYVAYKGGRHESVLLGILGVLMESRVNRAFWQDRFRPRPRAQGWAAFTVVTQGRRHVHVVRNRRGVYFPGTLANSYS